MRAGEDGLQLEIWWVDVEKGTPEHRFKGHEGHIWGEGAQQRKRSSAKPKKGHVAGAFDTGVSVTGAEW